MGRCVCFGWLVVGISMLWPMHARAQTTTTPATTTTTTTTPTTATTDSTTTTDGTTTTASTSTVVIQTTVDNNTIIGFLHPNIADDGAVISSCVYPTANCATFNASMCDPNYQGLPIEMSVQRGSAGVSPANVKAYWWVQPNNNTCSNVSLTGESNTVWPNPYGAATVTNLPTQSSFAGGTQGLTIPYDFANQPNSQPLTTKHIMQTAFPSACDPNSGGITYTRWRICLGVDTNGDGYINPPTGTTGDVTGYFEFLVDTTLPDSPNILSTTSLYKRVDVELSYDTTFASIYGLVVRSTDDPANLANSDCNSWNSHVNEQIVQVGYGGTGSGSQTMTMLGTNGVQYAYCAAVIDVVGNRSVYAGPAFDSPHTECDLFECYPDTPDGLLRTGFGGCATGALAAWWVPLAGLWWNVRKKRRRSPWSAGSGSIR